MAIMRFNFRSQVLSGYVDVSIVYPTDFLPYYDMSGGIRGHQRHVDRNYPVYQPGMKFQTIYLIHGGGDDDSLTYRYTNAELYAQKNYCMLVTPNICNSFGIDTAFGVNYSTFLTEELPLVIRSLFASSPAREAPSATSSSPAASAMSSPRGWQTATSPCCSSPSWWPPS